MNKQEAIRLWKKATRHPEIRRMRRVGRPLPSAHPLADHLRYAPGVGDNGGLSVLRAYPRHHGADGIVIEARLQFVNPRRPMDGIKPKRLITWTTTTDS